MNFLDEISGINAVVFFAQQGTMGGKAFADLVSGEATPSGNWQIRGRSITKTFRLQRNIAI